MLLVRPQDLGHADVEGITLSRSRCLDYTLQSSESGSGLATVSNL